LNLACRKKRLTPNLLYQNLKLWRLKGQHQSLIPRFALRNTETPNPHADKVKVHLKANLNFKNDVIKHKSTALQWWKKNSSTNPNLSQMA
jgi:hypothetical protein